MLQEFTIPGRLPGANEYQGAARKNRYIASNMKRESTDAAKAAARHLVPVSGPVNVRFTWIEPNMRRDKDNIRFGAKFILDGLVEAGILKDDGWTYINELSDRFYVNKRDPRVVVQIEEVRHEQRSSVDA